MLPATILAIDDSLEVLYASRRALRRAGFEVVVASTVAEAEAIWANGRPDLVLLDVNLPDGNGIELSHRWKADPDRRSVPIILRSGVSVSAAEQAFGLVSGADGYLTEPVETEVLVATVQAHLRIAQLIDQIELVVSVAEIGSFLWDGVARELIWRSSIAMLRRPERDSPPTDFSELLDCVHPEDRKALAEIMASMERNQLERVSHGFGFRCADGTLGYLLLVGQAVRDYTRGIVGFSAILVDTSGPTAYAVDTQRLVLYSIDLASVDTPEEVLDRLDSVAGSVLSSCEMRLCWSAGEARQPTCHEWFQPDSGHQSSLTELARLDATPLFVRDPSIFESTTFSPPPGQRSWAVVPFRVAGAHGVLVMAFPDIQRFDEPQQHFFRTFTNMTALALAQTSLLSAQRIIANTLQHALLPEPELLPGLTLGRELLVAQRGTLVGGDWFDGYVVDDDHQILVVGDVVGHGIEAAAHSAMFRHTLRTLCLSGFPMAAVLHKLDQLIYRDSRQPSGTLLILEVQVSTRTLTLTAAGHPPPIIVSASGESRVIDVEPNTLLGFGLVAKHAASTSIRLEPGDIVVAFTDGLVEQRGRTIDTGYHHLLDALQGAHSATDAIERARRVALARPAADDDALFIAVRLNSAAAPA